MMRTSSVLRGDRRDDLRGDPLDVCRRVRFIAGQHRGQRPAGRLGLGIRRGRRIAARAITNTVAGALHAALEAGTIAWHGNVRHVPTDADYDATTAWERVVGDRPKNHYQNGAYWGTPVGWVCAAVANHDEGAAHTLAVDFVADLCEDDFRLWRLTVRRGGVCIPKAITGRTRSICAP